MIKIGALAYVVNHTKKLYFCCDAFKWSEIILNSSVMYAIIEFLRHHWSNNKIEFTDEYSMEELWDKGYKEVVVGWEIYYQDYKGCK